MKGVHMTESKRKNDKIACPETHYLSPSDIAKDYTLSHEERRHCSRSEVAEHLVPTC
jgi:hypothetical protein